MKAGERDPDGERTAELYLQIRSALRMAYPEGGDVPEFWLASTATTPRGAGAICRSRSDPTQAASTHVLFWTDAFVNGTSGGTCGRAEAAGPPSREQCRHQAQGMLLLVRSSQQMGRGRRDRLCRPIARRC